MELHILIDGTRDLGGQLYRQLSEAIRSGRLTDGQQLPPSRLLASQLGLSRKTATEFSFFLAIPTLLAATFYSLYKARDILSATDVPLFGVGTVAAFISAFLCVRWLLRYISSHDFTFFAWYRIVFGLLVLASAHYGWVVWAA